MDRSDDAAHLRDIIECQREIMACGPDRERVMKLITERVQQLTDASTAIIELREDDKMVYRAATGAAAASVGTRLSIHASFSGRCVMEQKTLYCTDTETDPTVDVKACRRLNLRSMVVVPLRRGSHVIGVLKVGSAKVQGFDDGHVSTLELMTGFLSAALAHASEHEAAQRSIEIFEKAFTHAGIGMALVSLEGRWLRVNDVLVRILGYSRPALLKTDFQSITHPDDLAEDMLLVGRLLRAEIPSFELEKRYIHADGHIVHASLSVTLVRENDGRPTFFVAQVQDVSRAKLAESEVRAFFDMSPNLLAITGEGATFERVNPAWTRTFGWTIRELTTGSFLDFIHPDDLEPTRREVAQLSDIGSTTRGFRNRYRTQDGQYRWLEWDTRKNGGRVYCDARDVTEQQQRLEHEAAQARALSESEARFRALSEGSIQGIVVAELNGEKLHYVNDAAAKMFGFHSGQEMRERATLFSLMPHRSRRLIAEDWNRFSTDKLKPLRRRIELQRIDGQPLWVDLVGSVISWDGADALQTTMIDASAQVALEQALSKQATTDVLTSLVNRRHGERLAQDALVAAERDGSALSVLILDIDHFKSINDSYGHAGGDDALRAFAQVLEAALQGRGIAARWGGEEFVVLLPRTAVSPAREIAEQIRLRWMEHEVRCDQGRFHATVSIGVSERRPGERQLNELLERADRALYEAKRGGRNMTRVALGYDPALLEKITSRA